MTKPIPRKMVVDCLLWLLQTQMPEVFIKCYICGGILFPGDDIQFDHVHAHVHGGAHDHMNLRPVHHIPCHVNKTKKDVKANAKVKRIAAGGRKRKGKKIPSRPFPKRKK
jgi:hypothetical protein